LISKRALILNRKEIRIRGQGGQGAVTVGQIFGLAASLYMDKDSILTEAYGPEVTGGFARADVLIQDDYINYPLVENPDILIVMSQDAWQAEKNNTKSDAIVIYEKNMVHPKVSPDDTRKFYGVPALEMAYELKNKVVMNVILMAVVQEITEIVSKEAFKNALLDFIPSKYTELNIKAIEVGYRYARESLKEIMEVKS
jgi:2-oxoglutarate ferredoxin oxidoreductase subunit gamma